MNDYITSQFDKLPLYKHGHVIKNQTNELIALQIRLDGQKTNWVNISEEQLQAIYFVLNQV